MRGRVPDIVLYPVLTLCLVALPVAALGASVSDMRAFAMTVWVTACGVLPAALIGLVLAPVFSSCKPRRRAVMLILATVPLVAGQGTVAYDLRIATELLFQGELPGGAIVAVYVFSLALWLFPGFLLLNISALDRLPSGEDDERLVLGGGIFAHKLSRLARPTISGIPAAMAAGLTSVAIMPEFSVVGQNVYWSPVQGASGIKAPVVLAAMSGALAVWAFSLLPRHSAGDRRSKRKRLLEASAGGRKSPVQWIVIAALILLWLPIVIQTVRGGTSSEHLVRASAADWWSLSAGYLVAAVVGLVLGGMFLRGIPTAAVPTYLWQGSASALFLVCLTFKWLPHAAPAVLSVCMVLPVFLMLGGAMPRIGRRVVEEVNVLAQSSGHFVSHHWVPEVVKAVAAGCAIGAAAVVGQFVVLSRVSGGASSSFHSPVSALVVVLGAAAGSLVFHWATGTVLLSGEAGASASQKQ